METNSKNKGSRYGVPNNNRLDSIFITHAYWFHFLLAKQNNNACHSHAKIGRRKNGEQMNTSDMNYIEILKKENKELKENLDKAVGAVEFMVM